MAASFAQPTIWPLTQPWLLTTAGEADTPETFAAWLDRRRTDEPLHPSVTTAETLATARAGGEV